MDHVQIILRLILILVVGSLAVRSPPAIPQPGELEYLTSEEEERLIYGGDESVISDKVRHLPNMDTDPPKSRKALPAFPTMDPPLPKHISRLKPHKPPPKSQRGFPFRIPRIFLNNAARLITPLNRKPRWRLDQTPVASFRARPSTLVSSEPDELEVAFKRIEIMASRAGLNMSSMPRRTQMQVLKRLLPKLPPKMSYMVKSAMEGDSEKMYHYLPEPAKDPFEDPQNFSGIGDDINDEFQESIQRPHIREPGFDAGKVSIANHDANLEEFSHLPSITENYRTGSISHDLVPPLEHSFGKQNYNSFSDSFGESTNQFDREPHFSRDSKLGEKIIASPLVGSNFDNNAEASDALPMVISPGSFYKKDKVIIKSVKSTPTPIRVSLPTKDRFLTIKPTPRPIRVSIISKDVISVNRSSEPLVKVVHIEPVDEDKDEEVAAVVEEFKTDEVKPAPAPVPISNEVNKLPSRVKEISVDIIKEEEAKYKLIEAKRKITSSTSTTTTTTTTTTEAPDLSKLDMFEDWNEPAEELWSDPHDLTDEEIAATVAELKKYEEQGVLDNSLEQDFPWRLAPHPLEYPDHPDHPKDTKDSLEESKTGSEKGNTPASASLSQVIKRPSVPFNGHFRRPPGGLGPRRPPMRRPPIKRPMPPPRRPPGGQHRPSGPRPFRINDVTVSEFPKEYNKECDYFSEDLCLLVQDYPIEAISEALEQHPDAGSLLVKEPDSERSWIDGVQKNQEYNYNFKHYFGQRRSGEETTHRHRDFAGEGGFLCPSKVAYGKIKKAKSSTNGEWKFVVNYGDKTQTLRLEKCLSPGNTCSYVMPHYRTACTQVYNYHRLLAWDSEKGLQIDVFKVPTCCTCHVQGYYIPQNQHGFTPARGIDLPPKLKFTPPRTPMGRGLKRIPTSLNDLIHAGLVNKPTTTPSTSSTAKTTAKQSTAAKELKDDLQDLLAQYSALREKIAKTNTKKDSVEVSYSVKVSNTTDALRPKTRESRTSQFPFKMTDLKPFLKLKRLQMNLKKMNGTSKLKRPLARALMLASRTLKSRVNHGKSLQGNTTGKSNKTVNVKERIQTLRTRLNKYIERSKTKTSGDIPDIKLQVRSRGNTPPKHNSSNNSIKRQNQNQRLRLSSNRPSKVNYSYHPIMDYFNSKSRTR